jgi:hypothetical protein
LWRWWWWWHSLSCFGAFTHSRTFCVVLFVVLFVFLLQVRHYGYLALSFVESNLASPTFGRSIVRMEVDGDASTVNAAQASVLAIMEASLAAGMCVVFPHSESLFSTRYLRSRTLSFLPSLSFSCCPLACNMRRVWTAARSHLRRPVSLSSVASLSISCSSLTSHSCLFTLLPATGMCQSCVTLSHTAILHSVSGKQSNASCTASMTAQTVKPRAVLLLITPISHAGVSHSCASPLFESRTFVPHTLLTNTIKSESRTFVPHTLLTNTIKSESRTFVPHTLLTNTIKSPMHLQAFVHYTRVLESCVLYSCHRSPHSYSLILTHSHRSSRSGEVC